MCIRDSTNTGALEYHILAIQTELLKGASNGSVESPHVSPIEILLSQATLIQYLIAHS